MCSALTNNGTMKIINYLYYVCLIGVFSAICHAQNKEFELHPFDGYYNNLNHPDWGAVDDILLRKSAPAYKDGVYEPSGQERPNPFVISQAAHHGLPGLGSTRNVTAFLVFFGQQVVEEILDAQRPGCPREFFNIPVEGEAVNRYDPERKGLQMPFLRSRYNQRTGLSPNNPRQQLNEITPFLDGTLVYGPGKAWTDAIRELSEEHPGRLKARDLTASIPNSFPAENNIRLPFANPPPPREHQLKPIKRFWRIGNPRGNENPFLLAFGVLLFRYHNYVADEYALKYKDLNDEQVFNLARKKVIAVYQKIVMYDWLPTWLGINRTDIPRYCGPNDTLSSDCVRYNSNIHPGITQEFQTAAMRFGHTLVTPGSWVRDKPDSSGNCKFDTLKINIPGQPDKVHAIRLCNAYWNPQEFLAGTSDSFDKLLMGLASTIAEREDNVVVPDLREHVFGPLEFSRRDLMALNIQRGRDHGLADYNTVRQAYGLPAKQSWEDINTSNYDDPNHPDMYKNGYMTDAIARVKAVYGNTSRPDTLDLFSGGLLETTPGGPGELFRAIIMEQFLRIRQGDRFWFENRDNGLFDEEEIIEINKTTILDIVLKTTNIKQSDINADPFKFTNRDPCPQPAQLQADTVQFLPSDNTTQLLEKCTPIQTYDYFSGSEASFALTFLALGLCVPATFAVMILMARQRERKVQEARRKQAPKRPETEEGIYRAVEWIGPNDGERNVRIKFDTDRKKIHVTDISRKPLRMIDLRYTDRVFIRLASDTPDLLSVRIKGEIDLVLRFGDGGLRRGYEKALKDFLTQLGLRCDQSDMAEKVILKDATTFEQRKVLLEQFVKVVSIQQNKRGSDAFKTSLDSDSMPKLSDKDANEIAGIQLTRTEFADSLGLKPTSELVRNMFIMVDKDKNGLVSFQEFLQLFTILARGSADDKARMLFNMYDFRGKGELSLERFTKMIKSMLDLSDSSIDKEDLDALVMTLYNKAGIPAGSKMTFAGFKKVFASGEYEATLENASLELQGAGRKIKGAKGIREGFSMRRRTFHEGFGDTEEMNGKTGTADNRKSRINIRTKEKELPPSGLQQYIYTATKFIENYKRQIFWLTLYMLVSIGIFLERAFYYSFEREHVGLRRLAGYGVTVTRGAASGMMWTYSCLLLTMSRNTITFLRETIFHRFIPFDSFHAFHQIIAALALVFTVIHCVGHGINLYHISTWASGDLNCVFREYFRATNVLASFHYWAWTTITGLTGIVLTLIVIVMYVFALPFARRRLFKEFWLTHSLYIFLYIFMILHGSGRLVQAPLTQNYLYGPLFIYVVDKLISFSRKKVELAVKKAELLPSDVTALTFKRPINFEYKSGQWVRIACLELGENEYHPFTLTSAPHEKHLSLHIRAVGPWTMNIRKTYDINNRDGKPFPKVYVDGPFGEGHQDWYRYKVAVLVGGGIGVTPFASILKDIVFRAKNLSTSISCEKVYFLWVTRTQKQFEWLTDIIKEVEENDHRSLVNVHIFITQFKQKFDLRTTVLYICERHFQTVSGKSLFTGLKAKTHFGRPQFEDFFRSLHAEHPKVHQVGVFSCGPPPMTRDVDHACAAMNKYEDFPTYSHHYENF